MVPQNMRQRITSRASIWNVVDERFHVQNDIGPGQRDFAL